METESPARQQLAHLRALAAALEAAGLRAELHGATTDSPRLHVTSTRPPALSERVTCHQPPGQPWQFYWSSRQPIAAASEPVAAARAVAAVLRPVYGADPAGEAGHGQAEPSDGFDQTVPNAARIYDYLLGGQGHFDADRQAARTLLRAVPGARQAARDNRAWLGRAVRYLGRQGIRQFIDIGSGLPAAGPVHETAWRADPGARVIYADHDPVVTAHSRALLADLPPARAGQAAAITADLRYPRNLLADRAVRALIDPGRPTGVLLSAILHFIPDDAGPAGIIAAITARLAPGSIIAVSHVTADEITPDAELAARAAYASASAPAVPRSRVQVAALLAGLELLPPGLTDLRHWRRPGRRPAEPGPLLLYAAAARVPSRP